MSQMQEIRIQLEGVSTVLKTRRFKVPAYQRSYAWEREHVESLLIDISDAIRNKEKEYFLGSVTDEGEKVPSKDAGRVNLEHVLPLTLGEDWQDMC